MIEGRLQDLVDTATVSHFKTLLERIESRQAVISVVGLGYVGLALARVFADAGFRVLGIDIDEELAAKYPFKEYAFGGAWDTIRRADGSMVKP